MRGVVRELNILRGLARGTLMPNGRPRYRFIGLFDNDKAGRDAIKSAQYMDSRILEYRDVFRLHPVMPVEGNLDPRTLGRTFGRENAEFQGLDWELEDMLSEGFLQAFLTEFPEAVFRCETRGGRAHRDYSADGKACLHRYIRKYAMMADIEAVVNAIRALRFYMHLPGAVPA